MSGSGPCSFLLQRGSRGKGAAAPFPCTPNPRRPASALLRTISLDDSEHLLHNHHASVAALRLLFTFAPECRSASLRNRCSPLPEYPGTTVFAQPTNPVIFLGFVAVIASNAAFLQGKFKLFGDGSLYTESLNPMAQRVRRHIRSANGVRISYHAWGREPQTGHMSVPVCGTQAGFLFRP